MVRDLDDKAKLESYLALLGRLHQKHHIKRQYLDVMGPLFCQTVRPVLQAESQWSTEVREAWLHLFRMIAFRLKQGYKGKSERLTPEGGAGLSVVVGAHSPGHSTTGISPSHGGGGARTRAGTRMDFLSVDRGVPNGMRSHQRRRISMDEINDRKIRLQTQHCHLYQKKNRY